MFFLKPVNISSVERCKYLVIVSLGSFWAALLSFFLAPIWAFIALVAVHVIAIYLTVIHCHRLMVFLFLSKAGEGALPASANSTAAGAPTQQNGGFSQNGTPPIT